jgi:hypothetical protein
VVTNFGLNTKYHATPGHPVMIYYGDMDGSGNRHIVEAEWEGDTLFPVRGRSCSSQAMPFIKDKFSTFKAFATASLPSIYSPQKLEEAEKFSVTTLASGIYWNDGNGRFKFEALPWQVQAAPAFGAVISDTDCDGLPDIVIGQNFSYAQVETQRMAGGLGVLLKNEGQRRLRPLYPRESGLSLAGDVRSLAVVDLDSDRRADLAVGFNNAPVMGLRSDSASPGNAGSSVAVMLKGKSGNPTAIGARVTLKGEGLPHQTAEVQAGGGFLSQGGSALFFGLGKNTEAASITVRWPDGKTTEFKRPGAHAAVLLAQP